MYLRSTLRLTKGGKKRKSSIKGTASDWCPWSNIKSRVLQGGHIQQFFGWSFKNFYTCQHNCFVWNQTDVISKLVLIHLWSLWNRADTNTLSCKIRASSESEWILRLLWPIVYGRCYDIANFYIHDLREWQPNTYVLKSSFQFSKKVYAFQWRGPWVSKQDLSWQQIQTCPPYE